MKEAASAQLCHILKRKIGSNRIRPRQQKKNMHWQPSLLVFFDPRFQFSNCHTVRQCDSLLTIFGENLQSSARIPKHSQLIANNRSRCGNKTVFRWAQNHLYDENSINVRRRYTTVVSCSIDRVYPMELSINRHE